jgi:MSHA biogenesis protein MshJ
MKLPAALEKNFAKFNNLTLRERALVSAAVLVALVMIWTVAIFDRISAKERFLSSEVDTIQGAIANASQSLSDLASTDPTTLALNKEKKLQGELKEINEQLASRSGGLIEPERMVQVIHDVLAHQHGIALVSLQNKGVTPLIQPAVQQVGTADAAATDAESQTIAENVGGGPYVHTVELVIDGQYLDILDYLRALEALPWRFNWKVLELATRRYPLNRVTIQLTTLSMDKDWIGV